MRSFATLAWCLALVAAAALAGCDKCRSDDDCFGATPVCDVKKCGCLDDDACACTSRCEGEADCADGFSCNDQGFCEVDDGVTDPDCGG